MITRKWMNFKWPLVTYKFYYNAVNQLGQRISDRCDELRAVKSENESLKAEVTRLWTFINKCHSNKCQPRDKKGRWRKPVISEF